MNQKSSKSLPLAQEKRRKPSPRSRAPQTSSAKKKTPVRQARQTKRSTSHAEVLREARAFKRRNPRVSAEELKQHLEEVFVFPRVPDLLSASGLVGMDAAGAVTNPAHWWKGLSMIAKAVIRAWIRGAPDAADYEAIITAVVIIVMPESKRTG
jgi:hypothetical protein